MNLYRIETLNNGWEFCVVAKDPTAAEKIVVQTMNDADIGFIIDRVCRSITLVASQEHEAFPTLIVAEQD